MSIAIEEHSKYLNTELGIVVSEIEQVSILYGKQVSEYIKERNNLNMLSFGIVGSILSFSSNAQQSPLSIVGIFFLILNALVSFINTSRYRKSLMDNLQELNIALEKRKTDLADAFNVFLKNPTSEEEKIYLDKLREFKTWNIEEEVPGKSYAKIPIENYYFYIFAIALILITLGFIDWNQIFANLCLSL